MGKGYTLTHGAVCSASLNTLIASVSAAHGIPVQHELAGRDTGTDAMAAVLAAIDSAAASIGLPIRNMHTISESADELPDVIKNKYSYINWRKIKDFRNYIVHAYLGNEIDPNIVNDVVKTSYLKYERLP